MAIVKMKHLRLMAMRSDREALLRLLQRMGCVEIKEPEIDRSDPVWAGLTRPDTQGLAEARERHAQADRALATLKRYAPEKTGLFRVRPVISEQELFDARALAEAEALSRSINDGEARISALAAERSKLTGQKAQLAPWLSVDLPLDGASTREMSVLFGTVPASTPLEQLEGAVAGVSELAQLSQASADRELRYLMLICHRSVEEQTLEQLKALGWSPASLRGWTQTAAEHDRQADQRLEEIAGETEQAVQAVVALADRREQLRRLSDRASQDIRREEAKGHLLDTADTFYLTGWMPAKREQALSQMLACYPSAYDLADPEQEERVPTLLENPKWMRCINMVTEMYSLPAYNGIDPNPLIFFSYVCFFGFMFADVAYGLIIFGVSLFITKKYRPKKTMGYMFQLGQYLGLSTAFFGLFVGGFFGNMLEVVYENFLPGTQMPAALTAFCNGLVVNPVKDPMTVLILSMGIGCVQLIFGQLVHIYMGFRDGAGVDALLDVVPWWVVFAGIAAVALTGSPWLLAAGFLILLLTQGRHKKGIFGKLVGGLASWYDITSWLSDILSYARLMALMLATSVIAQVFNTLGALGGRTVFGVILFVVVFLVGHVFNIGVNLIGTYVHAARLHYLEFFSKFYKEGGIPFRPLDYQTKYVDLIEEEK